MKRPATSPGLKLIVLIARGARVPCAICGADQPVGEVEYDHIHSLALGGAHEPENIRPLCLDCHKTKTKADARDRGHIRRLTGETAKRPSRPIPSRGFDRTRIKKFNGQVVTR